MNLLKLGKRLLSFVVWTFIILFILTVLYYFDWINDSTYQILKLITLLLSIFIHSFLLGKTYSKKNYFEIIKFGLLLVLILLIPTLLFKKFQIKLLLYYVIVLSTSSLGSYMAIRKKNS